MSWLSTSLANKTKRSRDAVGGIFFFVWPFKRDIVNNVPAAQSSISSSILKSNPKKSVYGPIISNVRSFAANIAYASVAMAI